MKCPYCKSEDVVKRGLSPTRNRGKQQRYLCNACKKTFIQNLGFWKMKNNHRIITMAVDMYLSNLSSRKMRNQLRRHLNHKISHVSILAWVRKYIRKVYKFIKRLKPQLSGKIYADETLVSRQKKKDIFWCAIDWDTRFISSIFYSPEKYSREDALKFIHGIREHGYPKYIQTDALSLYRRAIRSAFWRTFKGKQKVEHKIINYIRTRKHNYKIETVFMKIKDRVDDFRGFKSLKSAPILMAGLIIQHNFIESHTTTGKIPCELAGLKLKTGVDRWLGLIRLSSMVS